MLILPYPHFVYFFITMAKKNKRPDLTLILDYGGSSTKGVYADASFNEKLLCMEPEVISLPPSAIADYEQTKLGQAQPADAAWVRVDNDMSYVVGYLARTKFHGNPGLSSLKYERAFPKTLAAVWVAAQSLKLGNKFNAALAILMPSSEYESGKQLHELLLDGLKDFQTPTGKMSVNLTKFECKPEGGGVYMIHRHLLGDSAWRKTVAVVMVGYRNASVLFSQRGQVSKRITCNLGFIKLVELVEEKICGIPATAELARAISVAGDKLDARHLLPLALSSVPQVRSTEAQKLADAVTASRAQYACVLCSWLKEVLPRQLCVDEVILCGGTAEYLRTELEQHFDYTQVSWNGGIELPAHLQDEELGRRLCDAYGMYVAFKGAIVSELTGVTANG